jgi:hypothetical protein
MTPPALTPSKRALAYTWGDLAAVVELTGDIPLTEAAARSHFKGKVPKRLARAVRQARRATNGRDSAHRLFLG